MQLPEFKVIRYNSQIEHKPFDCGDEDLNDFFLNDAKNYAKELLAVTYLFESDKRTIAFFSVQNDKIINKDSRLKTISNVITRKIPNNKRRPNYPAVKIVRLGVDKKHQANGFGTQIIKFIELFFIKNNKTGCRFITVDAYNNIKTLNFYEKNGFKFLSNGDEKKKTRLMYFDLVPLAKMEKSEEVF